jgi:hypothetical protein
MSETSGLFGQSETVTPEQQAAAQRLAQAQTPQEYAAAAAALGLTADARAAAQSGATPVAAPDFAVQLQQLQAQNAALQAQMQALIAQQPVQRHPVAAAIADVEAHLKRMMSTYPHIEWGVLASVVETAVSAASKL